ncbi:MAG: hypothetical protein HY355_06220 [Armatimonadetes bacterium]|nr:hypothetical protein [Armatimonadota bacterium]
MRASDSHKGREPLDPPEAAGSTELPGGPNHARKLEAFVVCSNARCSYHEGFADLRESPMQCPRCGHRLIRECGTCQMLLRSPSPTCSNCGRPIALRREPVSDDSVT